MRFIKRLLIGIGVMAAASAFLALVGPKAVHAAVAALVQVSNTATAPAITQGVPTFASQIVTLYTENTPGDFSDFFGFAQLTPQGSIVSGFNYVTPTTESLVITSIEFKPSAGTGSLNLGILNSSVSPSPIYESWKVPTDSMTFLQFPNGLVIGPNIAPALVAGPLGSTTAGFTVVLHGYLTTN